MGNVSKLAGLRVPAGFTLPSKDSRLLRRAMDLVVADREYARTSSKVGSTYQEPDASMGIRDEPVSLRRSDESVCPECFLIKLNHLFNDDASCVDCAL